MNKTIDYYNSNAELFSSDTLEVDFHAIQDEFLQLLPSDTLILDLGCGAGRDTKYFLNQGYRVEATDGSEELCEIASKNTGVEVKQLFFQDLNEYEKYDGIWACASLLHLKADELPDVFMRIHNALKKDGIFYASFKYGHYEGDRNGRYFTDMTEEKMRAILSQIDVQFNIRKEWITNDVRPGREEEKWLNYFLEKK